MAKKQKVELNLASLSKHLNGRKWKELTDEEQREICRKLLQTINPQQQTPQKKSKNKNNKSFINGFMGFLLGLLFFGVLYFGYKALGSNTRSKPFGSSLMPQSATDQNSAIEEALTKKDTSLEGCLAESEERKSQLWCLSCAGLQKLSNECNYLVLMNWEKYAEENNIKTPIPPKNLADEQKKTNYEMEAVEYEEEKNIFYTKQIACCSEGSCTLPTDLTNEIEEMHKVEKELCFLRYKN